MHEIKRAIRLLNQHPELDAEGLRALVPKPRAPKLRVPREKLTEAFAWVPPGYQHWLVEHHKLLRTCRGDASIHLLARLAGVSAGAVLKVERGDLLSSQRVVLKLVTLYIQLLEGTVPPVPPSKPKRRYAIQDAGLQLFAVEHMEFSPNYEVRLRALWMRYVEHADNVHTRVQVEANRGRKYKRVVRTVRLLRRSTLVRLLKLDRRGKYLFGARMRGSYDPVGDFLEQQCVREPLAMVRVSKLTRALHALYPDVHPQEIGRRLTRAGIWRDPSRKYYIGVRLR